LANSDLESFIIDNADGSRDPKISESWLAQQFAGIADALQLVHNPETSAQLPSRDMLDIPSNHPERTGYIHDIKPENILVFKKRGDPYLLRLSDFSCARVAEIEATISGKRDSYKTGTKSGTPIYRAP
jgi:serine/threonine protein kinase